MGCRFTYDEDKWFYQSFKGYKWQNIHKEITKKYLLNSYRVLLTRARQGFVIFIPKGDQEDKTRLEVFYDETYHYLTDKIVIDELK